MPLLKPYENILKAKVKSGDSSPELKTQGFSPHKTIKIPNEVTAKTLKDAENGHNVHKADSVDELFQELDG